MKKRNAHYGWAPDLPDHRDFLFTPPPMPATALPASVDLRPQCRPVFDQGQLGACTANAISNAHCFDQMKQKDAKVFTPSRLMIYYNERVMEGTVASDAGAQIRDGVKSIAQLGVCDEKTWPYLIAKFAKKPPTTAFTAAKKNIAMSYQRVTQTLDDMRACLAAGLPFVFGFSVYESFESNAVAASGKVPMPAKHESMLGGHAVLCVGYDDSTQCVTVMNSWGPGWGAKGFFYLPYAYISNKSLASDFWVVQTVKD